MRSHQTSRISQISHSWIKYEVDILFKRAIWEKLDKKTGSRPEMFCKKGVLRNFTKFTGEHLCQSLFFFLASNFIKKEILKQLFSCEFCETFKTPFLARLCMWQLKTQPFASSYIQLAYIYEANYSTVGHGGEQNIKC